MTTLHVDCSNCLMRNTACSDCVMSMLLGVPADEIPTLVDSERQAIQVLADSGLVPPLRLVPSTGYDTLIDKAVTG